uniref:Uncharacterized protein n=1 Tax=Triticum urartu TaxID=4572 RepID=A0A8R7QCB2_TRIUA
MSTPPRVEHSSDPPSPAARPAKSGAPIPCLAHVPVSSALPLRLMYRVAATLLHPRRFRRRPPLKPGAAKLLPRWISPPRHEPVHPRPPVRATASPCIV